MSHYHFAGTAALQPVPLPPELEKRLSHLHGTPVFFISTLLKLSRMSGKDKRICYVTDYTLNLSQMSGAISRCYKIEDMAELLVDASRFAIGIRMRERPFRRSTLSSERAYFEMPVDVVLFIMNNDTAAYTRLIESLTTLHGYWTDVPLAVRELKPKEKFSDLLVLLPDGSRVKPSPVVGSPASRHAPVSLPSSQTTRQRAAARSQHDEEPNHSPLFSSRDDVDQSADVEQGDLCARLYEAEQALYSARSELDDLRRSNTSFSQFEGLMWVYYDDLPAALQRELCAREELTHRTHLAAAHEMSNDAPPEVARSSRKQAQRSSKAQRSTRNVRSADPDVLGSQMDALLRELNRKQQEIQALESELKTTKRRKVQQLDDI